MSEKKSLAQRTFFALDGLELEQAIEMAQIYQQKGIYGLKIGMELFYKYGPECIKSISDQFKGKIFLDLKLHDISQTVFSAIQSLAGLPIDFLTIHLWGGRNMICQAVKSRDLHLPQCKLLGVTFLTNLDQNDFDELWNLNEQQVDKKMTELGHMASQQNIDGLILSAKDLACYQNIPRHVIRICPGIRFESQIIDKNKDDQKRIMTPQKAIAAGADYLVMGRPLRNIATVPSEFWR